MTACIVKSVACSDRTTEHYHPALLYRAIFRFSPRWFGFSAHNLTVHSHLSHHFYIYKLVNKMECQAAKQPHVFFRILQRPK